MFKKKPLFYNNVDEDVFESYVKKNIGNFDGVIHEIVSPDIHIDIIIVPPTDKKNFYTLITMGMGAYSMKMPQRYSKYRSMELAIRLPKYWDVKSDNEEWYWPIQLLKILARIPISQKTWLGYGHTIDLGKPCAINANFSAVILDFLFEDDILPLSLSKGKKVLIYNVIPLYKEEIMFKITNSANKLFDLLGQDILKYPVDIRRKNVINT